MPSDPCTCRHLPEPLRQAGARCGWCVQAIREGKNVLVRENNYLATELRLAGYERSSASEAAAILLKALGWQSGGLVSAAMQAAQLIPTTRKAEDAARLRKDLEAWP